MVYVVGLGMAVVLFRRAFTTQATGPGRSRITGVNAVNLGLSLVIAALTLGISASFEQVPAGARGVVLRFGAPTGVIKGEGLYMVAPFINAVELMSVQVVAYDAVAEAASRDLQDVKTKVTLNYSLDPDQVVDITERLDRLGLRAQAMSITDFAFSKAFNEAIEAKVTRAAADRAGPRPGRGAADSEGERHGGTGGTAAHRSADPGDRQMERAVADLRRRAGTDPGRVQRAAIGGER